MRNTGSETRPGRSAGSGVSQDLVRVREVAVRDKDARFTALLHHVSFDRLWAAFASLKQDAAPGTDGVRWEEYGRDLEGNLRDLHGRVQSGTYRAKSVRRVLIPKPDGRMRPLGVASLEDKIVQRALTEVLNAVFEADFRGISYGFRPGRKPHDALDALSAGIYQNKVSWVLDADIRDFFGQLDRSWLERFLRHRIADERVLRLIGKWLAAGVIEDGKLSESEQGTPQGAPVSPLLANVYLHHVLDLWAEWWRKHHARGDMIIVRFADDFVAGFQYQDDAERFQEALRERFAKFSLELHPDKTRLIEFGRYAAARRKARGDGETGDVLVPGVHAHLRDQQERAVLDPADHRHEAADGQASKAQSRAGAPPPRPRARSGPVAGQRHQRAHELLRRARQRQGDTHLPGGSHQVLAHGAAAPQPENPAHLGTDGAPRPTLATQAANCAPIPRAAVRRQILIAGAQCGNPARWDLRGGPPARAVPTAIAPG